MSFNNNSHKVLFADSVVASQTSNLIRELAKLLKQNHIDIGEKELYSWLLECGNYQNQR
ncbi:phage antirepressor KilAC domain-containing protein [Viridibacillus sp. NPDC096237]|uniref:phage antirepressor KilAC domain-containing protein n=1 Tax=Viridibacillus sp. NPDC096237 TaxID=3390721 RepID=UPI003D093AEE